MAKHRTRSQKANTAQRRSRLISPVKNYSQELQVQTPASFKSIEKEAVLVEKVTPAPIPPTQPSLLRVDKAYLIADLRRSMVVSLSLLMVLIGIFLLVRYNGFAFIQLQLSSVLT